MGDLGCHQLIEFRSVQYNTAATRLLGKSRWFLRSVIVDMYVLVLKIAPIELTTWA